MDKVGESLLRIFYLFFSIFLIWIIFLNVKTNSIVENLVSIIFIVSACSVIYLLGKNSHERKLKELPVSYDVVFWVCLLLLFIFIGQVMRVKLNWDFGTVNNNAYAIAKTGSYLNTDYFARYPNNVFILYLLVFVYKALLYFFGNVNLSDIYSMMIVINATIVWLGVYMLHWLLRKYNPAINKWIVGLIAILFFPTAFYLQIFYTDTVSFTFIVLFLILIAQTKIVKNNILNYSLLFFVGAFAAIGYKLKAFVIIIFIAMFIITLLGNDSLKRKFFTCITATAGFIITLLMIAQLSNMVSPITSEQSEKNELPLNHWVMMGLNTETNGGFNQKDYDRNKMIEGYDLKRKEISKEIRNRVDDFGVRGLGKFLLFDKLGRTWADGDFAFADYAIWDNQYSGKVYDFIQSGRISKYFQMTWLIFLGIFLFLEVRYLKSRRNFLVDVCNLSIFGFAIFELLWECNPRYLYCFIPVFICSFILMLYGQSAERDIQI